jgi:hypothetical protein
MIRAGVFIGVNRAGTLQRLNDAAKGASRMRDWAVSQGMVRPTQTRLITDKKKPVDSAAIKKAIKELLGGAGVDQLIVYFAGHGLTVNTNETWLLTDAPEDPSAAVNVAASVDLARYCGIHHVVVISDACRNAAVGIQQQWIQGVPVFPNILANDTSNPVDQLFACARGATAVEIPDAAKNYTALYTTAMLKALYGRHRDLLEPLKGGEAGSQVKTRRLAAFLKAEIPRLVLEKGLENKINQNPDDIIVSEATWLARLTKRPPKPRSAMKKAAAKAQKAAPRGAHDLGGVARELVRSAAAGDEERLWFGLEAARASDDVPGAADLADSVNRLVVPFGPDALVSECGFKVQGGRIVNVFAVDIEVDKVNERIVRFWSVPSGGASVVVQFDNGAGTVVPAIPGFIAALTVDRGELTDVAYEPSADTGRYQDYRAVRGELSALRAVAAAASREGQFRLAGAIANDVANRMRVAKSVDPSLALYAAYAFSELNAIDRVRAMRRYLKRDPGLRLFDIDMLARLLIGKRVLTDLRIVPFVPMLGQGWALLPAHDILLHPSLDGIQRHLRQSLWTLFELPALDQLRVALQTREVR